MRVPRRLPRWTAALSDRTTRHGGQDDETVNRIGVATPREENMEIIEVQPNVTAGALVTGPDILPDRKPLPVPVHKIDPDLEGRIHWAIGLQS